MRVELAFSEVEVMYHFWLTLTKKWSTIGGQPSMLDHGWSIIAGWHSVAGAPKPTKTNKKTTQTNQRITTTNMVFSLPWLKLKNEPHDMAAHAEPDGLTCAESHPLWAKLCHQCLSLHPRVQKAFLLDDVIGCRSSCCIAVSTKGRVLCQSHRCGFQCHGGGKRGEPLLLKLHSIRRELWMESNLDICSNPAVKSLGHPCLVMQDAWWACCLVQICILDDAQIEIDQGVVRVGGVQLWSREKARDTQWYPELAIDPTPEHIKAGQFYAGDPVMHVVHLDDIWRSPHKWRSCDWMTFVMLREHLENMSRQQWIDNSDPKCVYVGDVTAERLRLCERVMSQWSVMDNIDRDLWPLLITKSLYNKWRNPAWRHATVKSVKKAAKKRRREQIMIRLKQRRLEQRRREKIRLRRKQKQRVT